MIATDLSFQINFPPSQSLPTVTYNQYLQYFAVQLISLKIMYWLKDHDWVGGEWKKMVNWKSYFFFYFSESHNSLMGFSGTELT